MKQVYLTIVSVLFFFAAQNAEASLLADACVSDVQTQTWAAGSWGGVSCKNIQLAGETLEAVNYSIGTVGLFTSNLGLKAALIESATALGMSTAASGGTVLVVTILAGAGYVTLNIVMNKALKDCANDQDNIRQIIREELLMKYGVKSRPDVPLTIGQ